MWRKEWIGWNAIDGGRKVDAEKIYEAAIAAIPQPAEVTPDNAARYIQTMARIGHECMTRAMAAVDLLRERTIQ